MRIATGQEEERVSRPEDEGKDPIAVALGKRRGKARAASLTRARRKEIAKAAAKKRWS
jgi:hypothetical protein